MQWKKNILPLGLPLVIVAITAAVSYPLLHRSHNEMTSGQTDQSAVASLDHQQTSVSPSQNLNDDESIDIPLAEVSPKLPPLELQREEAENQPKPAGQDIQIEADFECGTAISVRELSPTHFIVRLVNSTTLRDWFMFRVIGAAGRIVRFDIQGGEANDRKWTSLNPVFTDATDLDALATYSTVTSPDNNGSQQATAWNGSVLPSTAADHWHFIGDCWMDDGDESFSFVQRITSSSEYVAMRVPRPPGYNELFLKQLGGNPRATVIKVGTSQGGHPLQLVKFSSGGDDGERHKPCLLIYAGEHADEQDAMWAAQGAIEFLAGDSTEAKAITDRLTVLVIPTFDPDASIAGTHSGVIVSFLAKWATAETNAYANWFQSWINDGKRLDIVLDLHNVQSREAKQLTCGLLESVGIRGACSDALHSDIVEDMRAAGFVVDKKPWQRGWMPDRLGGWLSRRYGPITLLYELNSQAAPRHLDVQQLKQMGSLFVESAPGFVDSQIGRAMLADVDARRQERIARWASFKGAIPANAIDAEATVSYGIGRKTPGSNELLVEKWIN